MFSSKVQSAAIIGLLLTDPGMNTWAGETAPSRRAMFDKVGESLAVIRYTWASEIGSKELSVNGVVIDASGVVMIPLAGMDDRIPESQIKNVMIVVPQPDRDPLEIAADLQGRDTRSMLAYVKARSPSPAFKPLNFSDGRPGVGDVVFSIGLMSKSSGYQPYVTHGSVAAVIRADHTRAFVDGNLGVAGSPVMADNGDVIGFVNAQATAQNSTPDGRGPGTSAETPSFTPSHDFLAAIGDRPTPDRPVSPAWLGTAELAALGHEQLEYYGLSTPALQVTAVAPQSPADKAGIKPGQMIVKLNGQPIERGRTPEFTAAIFRRRLQDMRAGDKVTLDLVTDRNRPATTVALTLDPMPLLPNSAERYWTSDLAFGVRAATYFDFYQERLPTDGKGVLVTLTKPGGPAATGGLSPGSFVLQIDGQSVTDLHSFKTIYAERRQSDPQAELLLLVRRQGIEQTVRVRPPQ